MTDREAFLALISKRLYDAEAAFVRGDVGPRLQMWSHHDPVSLFGAVGVSKNGWDELSETFPAIASRLSGGHDVTYKIVSFDVGAEMAWTAGIVRFIGTTDGDPAESYTLRITCIYRLESGEWKMVHEHSDFQPNG